MFERFTEQARRAVVLAQLSAHDLAHSYLGTEHLLLGLLRHEGSVANRALDLFDVTTARAMAEVEQLIGRGVISPPSQLPFTDGAKQALERSQWESRQLRHDHIGTGHLLLGLVRPGDNTAVRVLAALSVKPEVLRTAVVQLFDGGAEDVGSGEPGQPGETGSTDDAAGPVPAGRHVATAGMPGDGGGGAGQPATVAGSADASEGGPSVALQLAHLTAVVEGLRAEVARLAALVEEQRR